MMCDIFRTSYRDVKRVLHRMTESNLRESTALQWE